MTSPTRAVILAVLLALLARSRSALERKQFHSIQSQRKQFSAAEPRFCEAPKIATQYFCLIGISLDLKTLNFNGLGW